MRHCLRSDEGRAFVLTDCLRLALSLELLPKSSGNNTVKTLGVCAQHGLGQGLLFKHSDTLGLYASPTGPGSLFPLGVCWRLASKKTGWGLRVRHVFLYIHAYIHPYIHTCIHTYIHTCTHAYIAYITYVTYITYITYGAYNIRYKQYVHYITSHHMISHHITSQSHHNRITPHHNQSTAHHITSHHITITIT